MRRIHYITDFFRVAIFLILLLFIHSSQAFCAMRMPPSERRRRMKRLRRNVREQDIHWWVNSFMRAVIDKELKDFPVLEELIPSYHHGQLKPERAEP